MGFDENRFDCSVDEDFRCLICRYIIEDPIATYCEHVFCKICINEWLQEESSCPVDRRPLDRSQLCEPSRFFRNYYSKLELKCEYEPNGCEMLCQIMDVKSHENICRFNPSVKYECNNGCGALINKIDEKNHNCFQFMKFVHIEYEKDLKILTSRVSQLEKCVENLQTILSINCDEVTALKQEIESLSAHCSETGNKQALLVETLKAKGMLKSSSVATALLSVDRKLFCSSDPYSDEPKNIGFGSTISAPHIHALILELLKDHLENDSVVLDIGSGSGYLAICMAKIIGVNGKVIGIDHLKRLIKISSENVRNNFPDLINKVTFVVGDGRNGYSSCAPYDVINIGGAVAEVPQTILDQLKVGGRLIAPVGQNMRRHELMTFDKLPDGTIRSEVHQNCYFGCLKDLVTQLEDAVIPIPGFQTMN